MSSTFSPTRTTITHSGTLNDTTVEFITTDGSTDVSGHFKNSNEATIGALNFNASACSLNIYLNQDQEVDIEDVVNLFKQVHSFLENPE
jgi:hypothetical protein